VDLLSLSTTSTPTPLYDWKCNEYPWKAEDDKEDEVFIERRLL
jgi:hypothetical protein